MTFRFAAPAVIVSVALALCPIACPTAAADELETMVSTSLSSALVDVSALDINAADRALMLAKATADQPEATGIPANGLARVSGVGSSTTGLRRSVERRNGGVDQSAQLAARDEAGSDALLMSRVAFPMLVGSLAADSSSFKVTPATLRTLAGPTVGVRPSFMRTAMGAGR